MKKQPGEVARKSAYWVQVIYQVIAPNGEMITHYTDKKTALRALDVCAEKKHQGGSGGKS